MFYEVCKVRPQTFIEINNTKTLPRKNENKKRLDEVMLKR